jgi:hypothetical protein
MKSLIKKYPRSAALCFGLITVMIIFSVLEVLIRNNYPYPPPSFGFTGDSDLGHFIKPGFHKAHITPDGEPYDIFTNSMGMFDREYNGEQPVILLVGDSFTISAVPYEHKWGTLLEKDLNIRTVKAGVTAYGTYKEYLLLRKLYPGIRAGIIILGHYINDPIDDYIGIDRYTVIKGHLHEKRTMDITTGEVYRKSLFGYLKEPSRYHIALLGFLSDKLNEFLYRNYGIRPELLEFDPTYGPLFDPKKGWTEKLYEINFRNILDVKKYAESWNAHLIVLAIPAKEQVYPEKWEQAYREYIWYDSSLPTKRLTQFLEKNDIMYIDLLSEFKAGILKNLHTPAATQYYFDNDIHWNKQGDRLVAEITAQFIKENGLLSSLTAAAAPADNR